MRKTLTVLFVLSAFLLFSCAGKKTSYEKHGKYHYGVIPVQISDKFIKTLYGKTRFYEQFTKMKELSNKVYYYYYYYLFHPKVIKALSLGDNKIKNLPITLKIRNKIIKTKINIEYPEYLAQAFQICKDKGGNITIQTRTIYNRTPVDNTVFLKDYNVLISKENFTLSLYPNFVCVKDNKVIARYIILPFREIQGVQDKRYTSDYSENCTKKLSIYSFNPAKYVGDKISSLFSNGCYVYVKYCIQKIRKYPRSCRIAGKISGIGLKAVYDTVFAKDGFWNCGTKKYGNQEELKRLMGCKMFKNCKDVNEFCEVRK